MLKHIEMLKQINQKIKHIEDGSLTYVDSDGKSLPTGTLIATTKNRAHYVLYPDGSLGEKCFRSVTYERYLNTGRFKRKDDDQTTKRKRDETDNNNPNAPVNKRQRVNNISNKSSKIIDLTNEDDELIKDNPSPGPYYLNSGQFFFKHPPIQTVTLKPIELGATKLIKTVTLKPIELGAAKLNK